jgi:hypothetical protein
MIGTLYKEERFQGIPGFRGWRMAGRSEPLWQKIRQGAQFSVPGVKFEAVFSFATD